MTMIVVVCADVIMRMFSRPIKGALDIVKLSSAVTIACALPYTTAVKGHVAIEYFFLKLSKRWKIIVDTFARTLYIALFCLFSYESYQYGYMLKRTGQTMQTLQIPEHYTAWIISVACGVVVLVIIHNLMRPGRLLIKP